MPTSAKNILILDGPHTHHHGSMKKDVIPYMTYRDKNYVYILKIDITLKTSRIFIIEYWRWKFLKIHKVGMTKTIVPQQIFSFLYWSSQTPHNSFETQHILMSLSFKSFINYKKKKSRAHLSVVNHPLLEVQMSQTGPKSIAYSLWVELIELRGWVRVRNQAHILYELELEFRPTRLGGLSSYSLIYCF